MKKTLFGFGAIGLLIAGVALGAGIFPGFPAPPQAWTGTEFVPADTGYVPGLPQTIAVPLNQLTTAGTAAVTLTDAATITPNAQASTFQKVTIAGNRTMANPTNPALGEVLNLQITQGAGGSHTITWGSQYFWAGGTAPTLTTTAAAIDLITCTYNGADWLCSAQLAMAA